MQHEDFEVTISEATVVIRRRGSSIPTVANILGCEVGEGGKRQIWLDRTIHSGAFQQLNAQWSGRGAVSTELVEQ